MTADADSIPAQAAPRAPSMATRWYVLVVTVLVYTLSIADRYVTSTVLDSIRVELHMSDSGIAFVTGVALAWFYVILGFPVSWLIDRFSRRNIIALSMIAWSAMTTFTGLARSQLHFLLARIGVGIGEAGGTPGANSLLSDYFPVARRPMALTIFSLGAPIGAWIASTIAGAIADRYGWRQVFIALGIPGVVAGIVVFLTVREPRRGQLDHKDEGAAPSFVTTMRFLLQQRSAIHVMIGSAVTALWGWGLMFWTPAFLQRTYSLTPGQTGDILGPMHLFGGAAATLFTGWLLAQPVMADPRRIVKLLGWWIGAGTVVSIFIYASHSLAVTKALCWLFVPSIYFYIGPCFGILNNLAQPRMRAIFCAATLFVANVGNLVIAPQMVGFLSDFAAPPSGPNAASLQFALLCLAPTGFWATAHYFWSVRDLARDQERATGIPV
ncbi:MAG: MFS transporter [Proteobacteria bacterium]|nr:MFS transporter [Pseudomonadota bacterium]